MGGTGEFTSADLNTLLALGTPTGGFASGSVVGLDTTNTIGGNFTYSTAIANPNGGSNILGLTKLGSNSLTLGGASTYTGSTIINAGTLRIDAGGSIASVLVSVASGATLQLAGSIGRALERREHHDARHAASRATEP